MTRWLLLAAAVSLVALSGCAWYVGPDDYIVGYSDYIYTPPPPPPPPAYYRPPPPPPVIYYGPPAIYYHAPWPFLRFDFDFHRHGDRDHDRRDHDDRGRR